LISSTGLKGLAEDSGGDLDAGRSEAVQCLVGTRMEGNQELREVLILVDPRLFVEARMEEAQEARGGPNAGRFEGRKWTLEWKRIGS
jgi:hypothetical protein